MTFTSPLAIFMYVVSAISLIATAIAHIRKEKYISSILQSSPTRRTRLIKSYKNMIKLLKLLTFVSLISIIAMISSYFILSKDDFFLLMIGFAVVVLVTMIADILLRQSVVTRVDIDEYAADPQFTANYDAPADTAAKVRKVNLRLSIIGISITFTMFSAFAAALYFTIGGPVLAYVLVTLFALLIVLVILKTTVK